MRHSWEPKDNDHVPFVVGMLCLSAMFFAAEISGCLKGGSVQQTPSGTETCLDWAKKNPTAACDAGCATAPNAVGGK